MIPQARVFRALPPVVSFCIAVVLLSASASAQHFQVTITNLTQAQVFTPIMVASQKPGVKLFTLGQPASTDLEHVAEAGDLSEIEATLRANPNVLEVVDSGATLGAGQSVTLTVRASAAFSHLSVVAMLIPTNDGFFALNDEVGAVSGSASVSYYSPAYDAGTEANDELCAHIPGPPNVCNGEGFNPARDDVNFVHIHSGIHGVGDLSAATYDWRNPVAKIVITRVP
jgi:hypothetical protein